MEKHLFLAAFLMFLLSLFVLFRLWIRRVRDVAAGTTDPTFFKTYDIKVDIPRPTKQLGRNHVNLYETPVLFYAIIGLILALDLAHIHLVVLAYGYVACRYIHTLIHTTNNRIYPRMIVFMMSFLVLTALWSRTLFLLWFP